MLHLISHEKEPTMCMMKYFFTTLLLISVHGWNSQVYHHTSLYHQTKQTKFRLKATADTTTETAELDSTLATQWKNEICPEALRKMETIMKNSGEDFFCSSSSSSSGSNTLKQMYVQISKHVEIKPSSIKNAGLGLFAKKNIKANTIVSFYPAHALGIEFPIPQGQLFFSNPEHRDYFAQNPSNGESPYLHVADQPIFNRPSILTSSSDPKLKEQSTTHPIYLDVNPQDKSLTKFWVSQYINDGATVKENSEEGVLEYYKESQKKKNCIHIPFSCSPILATVTTGE